MCFERSVVRSQAKARYFRSFCRLIIPWPSLFLLPEQQEAGAASLFVRRPLIFSSSTLPHSRFLLLSPPPLSPSHRRKIFFRRGGRWLDQPERERIAEKFIPREVFLFSIYSSVGWLGWVETRG